MPDSQTLVSPLHELHLELGAKMGPFAGYSMPLWYPDKILAEHKHTRTQASLFDISHMGQASIVGFNAASALESLIPTDFKQLPYNKMHYCCFTNDEGGILDDLIVANLGLEYFVVMNAACKKQDLKHLQDNIQTAAVVEHTENALLALQGPKASEVMKRFHPEVCNLDFMTIDNFNLRNVPCIVSRSGYTGEDGFEISMPVQNAQVLARELLKQAEVKPAGLGARDSLRLEAGLRLYGQDMNHTTTPVEAGIAWTISKSRRFGGEREGGFPGADVILSQIANGPSRRIGGILLKTKAPARTGTKIFSEDGTEIGTVTSGMFAPTVKAPIAMGYIDHHYCKLGTVVQLQLRKKLIAAEIVRLPFVEHQYHNIAKLPA